MSNLEQFDTVADLVLYYVDVLDALGIGRAALVGHSVGGMVAAEVATDNAVDRLEARRIRSDDAST